ncbi:MAG: hypothetical protein PHV16_01350 [Candidatus Nanoarchaeia archaeon]|nr:hypothetical protein [Candidatus Nanoarchaeia archaeon]
MEKSPLLQTGVDKLVSLIKEKKRISVPQAAKQLGVSHVLVEEWADFLEEDDIISIEYRLATPWLVDKKLKKEELKKRIKEFQGKKEVLIRKSESLLGFLNNQGDDITKIREEFKNLKNQIQNEASGVKVELEELQKFEGLRENIRKQIKEQEDNFKERIEQMNDQVNRAQKKYSELLNQIGKETKAIKLEKIKAESIKEIEEELKQKINKIEETVSEVKKKVEDQGIYVEDMEDHINHLKKLASETRDMIKTKRNSISSLSKEMEAYEQKVKKIQNNVLKKVYLNTKKIREDIKQSKELSEKFKNFFDKKMETIKLIDKIDQDRNEIKKELDKFIQSARAFSASSDSEEILEEVTMMEKKFKDIDVKKNDFEKEIKKLSSIIKSKR